MVFACICCKFFPFAYWPFSLVKTWSNILPLPRTALACLSVHYVFLLSVTSFFTPLMLSFDEKVFNFNEVQFADNDLHVFLKKYIITSKWWRFTVIQLVTTVNFNHFDILSNVIFLFMIFITCLFSLFLDEFSKGKSNVLIA